MDARRRTNSPSGDDRDRVHHSAAEPGKALLTNAFQDRTVVGPTVSRYVRSAEKFRLRSSEKTNSGRCPAFPRRAAAYFDLGVEHGVAAARADQLRAGRAVKKLADRLVREALGADVPREDVAAAAVMAAWAVLGSRPLSAPAPARAPA
jgi:hypothetical protein